VSLPGRAARVLLISGSTRGGSVNTAALATVAALAPPGVAASAYDGLAAMLRAPRDPGAAPGARPARPAAARPRTCRTRARARAAARPARGDRQSTG
jgi:NAD(P)H-dependent FMN reductase